MKNRTIEFLSVAMMCLASFGLGYFAGGTRTENQMLTRATADELQYGLDVYRECMQSAGRTGCRMSVENFRTYHAIKREIERRQTTGAE